MFSGNQATILGTLLVIVYLASKPLFAAEKTEQLPEPFTLEQALAFADRYHPDLAISESDMKNAEASLLQAEAHDDIDVRLRARVQWIDPAERALNQDSDNHQLSLLVEKPLYDFGLQEKQKQQASKSLQAQKFLHANTRQQRRLIIMRRFFNVLLADLNFYRYNEEMATAFVRLDKLRDRFELGQVSELDVLEQEVEYQKMRRLRLTSRNNQRLTRSALALSLGNLKLIADTLVRPDITVLDRKLPEVEELQKQALQNNVTIKSLQSQLTAVQQSVSVARNSDNPVLKGQLEAHAYSRETRSSDPWRAGVVLEIPLTKGSRTDANVAKERANLYKVQSSLARAKAVLQQQVLQLWTELEAMKIKRDEMQALAEYSELYLDKSRVLYEMEVRSTLGDAMITVTRAQYEALETDFDIAYAWARMDALTGSMIKPDIMNKEH